MATHTASKFMRNFPQRYGMNKLWYQSILQSKRYYYTGDRYQGYVSFFSDELFGFVVREDLPDTEYYFHSTDLHARNVPRVRPLQQVEFSIVEGRGGNYIARDITAPNSVELEFNHANMRLTQQDRNQKLSSLPDGLHDRHKGVVVTIHADGSGGLIVPDRLNFEVVSFRMNELQSTGFEKLDRFSEVEFFVRPARFENARDRAVCITRPGGGLITGERKDIGSRRRQLGAMYSTTDTKARVPQEFMTDRQRGIIVDYEHGKLFGFIAPLDNPSEESLFVHCDDCHIGGKRMLKTGQLVEYVAVRDDNSSRTKALHVTGPNLSIIRSISDNHYLPQDLCTLEYDADGTTRHQGSVIARDMNNRPSRWYLIKPNERGYKSLFTFPNEFNVLGSRRGVQVGSAVEFSVSPLLQDNEDGNEDSDAMRMKATNVTSEGGLPILTARGKYARYLQCRLGLPLRQAELPLAPLSTNNKMNGYVSAYNRETGHGSIEIEAPTGERYQKVSFEIGDCVLPAPSGLTKDTVSINSGLVIRCNVNERGDELSEQEKEILERGGTLLQRKASNITSPDMDILQVREFVERQTDDMDHDDDNFGQTQQRLEQQRQRQRQSRNMDQDMFADERQAKEV